MAMELRNGLPITDALSGLDTGRYRLVVDEDERTPDLHMLAYRRYGRCGDQFDEPNSRQLSYVASPSLDAARNLEALDSPPSGMPATS